MDSPALIIPADIIREIFCHLAIEHPVLFTRPGRHGRFPWVLGHICSEWRAIFLSMKPQFWSRIAIQYEERHCDLQKVRRVKEMLEFFLNRNRADVFSFSYMVLGMTVPSDAKAEDMHPVLDLLVEASMRWENAWIMVAPQDIPVLRRIKNRLPFLRKLNISTREPGFSPASNDMFEHAPLLQEVTISDPSWKLNWSALNTVELQTSVTYMLAILPQIPNVETLHLLYPDQYDRVRINDYDPITLPRLKTLMVRYQLPLLLGILEAPKLESLTLTCVIGNSIPPSGTTYPMGICSTLITTFLSRSSCPIRYLCLPNVIDEESLADILRYTPNVESLQLGLCNNRDIGSCSMACLSLPGNHDEREPSHGLLASYLKSLTIVAVTPDDVHADPPFLQEISMLIRIVKSRATAFDKNEGILKERLQKLMLTLDMPSTLALPNELTDLKSLCAEVGVDFRCSFRNGSMDMARN